MIGILCDSGSDLPPELAKIDEIEIVPLKLIMGEKEYRETEISEKEIVEFMKTGIPRTSLPSYEDVKLGFERLINRGYKEIIVINISGKLSGTHNPFKFVGAQILEEIPDLRIEYVDSMTLSGGIALLVELAVEMIESGMDIRGIVFQLRKSAMEKLKIFLIVPTLRFLRAGGRISKVSASIGEALNFKPIITMNQEGDIVAIAKARGMKRAVVKLIQKLEEETKGKKLRAAAVYHSGSDKETLEYAKKLKEKLLLLGAPKIMERNISSVLLVHASSGLVGAGVLFM
ncbi:DegV family protein [Kosmotoga sp.]|uniref:DegV family protein n=1 Tax=Kosmotoga sp. TaxID=1955248 RepID=UPI0025C641A4|nr:DegV family protein [Kosmotoga sp.]